MPHAARLLSAIVLLMATFDGSVAHAAEPAGAASESKKVPLQVLGWEDVQKLVARQKGKVVVLDLWSTYCLPCMREFPHLVELQKRHPRDVACLSMNLNYAGLKDETPESFREEVHAFLRKQGAEFQNVISKDPDTELFEKLDLASIPAVYVFDRKGRLAKRFDNDNIRGPDDEFTYQKDVTPLVEKLVSAK